MPLIEKSPSRATPEKIWGSIAQFAEEMQLASGAQLPGVRDLAERLGEKPTLIRDALLHAQACGAVRIVPRVGAFLQADASQPANGELSGAIPRAVQVAIRSGDENLLHLLDARRLIEVELIGRVAEFHQLEDLVPARRALDAMLQLESDSAEAHVDLDIRFHLSLARIARNNVLAGILETLLQLLRPYFGLPWSPGRRQLADHSHSAIYAAILDRDVERTRQEMLVHLNQGYELLLAELRRLPTTAAASINGRHSPTKGGLARKP